MPSSSLLEGMESQPVPRFIVGIDLGTTNCAMAYVDCEKHPRKVEVFLIPQLVDWNTVEKRTTLPSFHYEWTEREAADLKNVASPFTHNGSYCVGVLARERGLDASGRQIASAKSWLCHSGVDRSSPILPWHGDPNTQRLSPVVVSSRYLEHLRMTWDLAHPQHPLSSCEVVVTLPASFDEIARELTIEAARLAGLPRIVLIEEPQAAFYAWLSKNEQQWQETIRPGQSVLICDIGGGTTDFTLIRVRSVDEAFQYGLHRVAVGQHLMLGGDNFDLALAKAVEPEFSAGKIDKRAAGTGSDGSGLASELAPMQLGPHEFEALRQQARIAKEKLLTDRSSTHFTFSIAGRGSRLLGSVRSVDVGRTTVETTLLDGFFPIVSLDAKPATTEVGLMEFGLPYATDSAITRYLAQFLWEHRWDGRDDAMRQQLSDRLAARPDWVLFNGGVLESPLVRERLKHQLNTWFAEEKTSTSDWQIGELPADQLDLAVAIGAAYFGLVRRGEGVRIDARLARAYYLQVAEEPPQVLCVMPGDAMPLDHFTLEDHPFELEIGRPIQFPIFVSSSNLIHRVGQIVAVDRQHMLPLPPIQTVLESTRHKRHARIPIVLESQLSEIGTLDLSLIAASDDRKLESNAVASTRWRLAFDLRSTVETDREAHRGWLEQTGIVEQQWIDQAKKLIGVAFGEGASVESARNLIKTLSTMLGVSRHEWKPSLLRGIWQSLIECDPQQKRSAILEGRWLNLLGYTLRPGYGYAADDWRVATTWRLVQGKLKFPSNASEATVLWRRIAGGFTAGQQQALFQEIQGKAREILDARGRAFGSLQESIELLRLAGSLELVSLRDKKWLGELSLKALDRPKMMQLQDSILWMLGRLGARTLVYGPLNQVVPIETVHEWIRRLISIEHGQAAHQMALMQLARRTGDRYRDVATVVRDEALIALERWNAPSSYLRLVREVTDLDRSQNETIVGETMPLGIRLRN